MRKLSVLIGLLSILTVVKSANILGIWFHAAKSHHIPGEALFKELARRGHNVTMVSTFPLNDSFPNYTDVHLTDVKEDQESRSDMFMELNKGGVFKLFKAMVELTRAQTEMTLVHPAMREVLESGTKFDLIITDCFLGYGIYYFGKLLNAPVIPLASQGTVETATVFTGIPEELSYVPRFGLNFPVEMSFFQRFVNSIFFLLTRFMERNNIKYHQDLVQKYFNDSMTEEEMVDTLALVLSNGHYSFEWPKPLVPNVIPVGGFHVAAPKPLSKQFQDFLDSADKGAILFSLGSNVKSTTLPEETVQAIMNVFSSLPYKIIFKWEKEEINHKPKNVLSSKWCPQNDILAHPNLKLFISHGGLLSTIEAIHHAVPVLGIPIFGDQKINIPSAVKKGYAVQLDLENLNEESFSKAIKEMMDNPKYKEKVSELSFLLKDQPMAPMDTAVFWVEHVIRHKGASHLKNYRNHLSLHQYYMIDVIFVLTLIVLTILTIVYFISKKLLTGFELNIIMRTENEKLKSN